MVIFEGCGGIMSSVSGEIISPDYPQQYHRRSECYWTIKVNEGSSIKLHFVDLDLEADGDCTYDYVEVSNFKFFFYILILF